VGLSKKLDISGVLDTGRPLAVDTWVRVPSFGSYAFSERAHVILDLHRIDRDLGIAGRIEAIASGVCDRCLADVQRPVEFDVEECLSVGPAAEGDFAESNVLTGTLLDVGDLTRQLIDSAVPMVLLCSDDCPGLCPVCGLSRREEGCTCPVSIER
jgi:uncharacterized metal-binding protein YceD (DUF177 family)